jgi:hypothetical protein
MKSPEQPDTDLWDNDPLSHCISEYVEKLPDRPKVIIAIISLPKQEDEIAKAMLPFKEAFLTFLPLREYTAQVSFWLLGFDLNSSAKVASLLECLGNLAFREGAIYVEGTARLRIAPVKRRVL